MAMTVFKQLILFSNFLETEEDYSLWILALYKLCKNNIEENPELELIQNVVKCAMNTATRTGSYINYFSKQLAATMQQIPIQEVMAECTD